MFSLVFVVLLLSQLVALSLSTNTEDEDDVVDNDNCLIGSFARNMEQACNPSSSNANDVADEAAADDVVERHRESSYRRETIQIVLEKFLHGELNRRKQQPQQPPSRDTIAGGPQRNADGFYSQASVEVEAEIELRPNEWRIESEVIRRQLGRHIDPLKRALNRWNWRGRYRAHNATYFARIREHFGISLLDFKVSKRRQHMDLTSTNSENAKFR